MIDIFTRFTRKYFESIKSYVRFGYSHIKIFRKLKELDPLTTYGKLRGGIKQIKAIADQADRFKYIPKSYRPTNRFYNISDRTMGHDRWSYFRARGTSVSTGELIDIRVKITHDEAQNLTRGQLEEMVRDLSSSEYFKPESRLEKEGIKVSFDYGTRKNPKYQVSGM